LDKEKSIGREIKMNSEEKAYVIAVDPVHVFVTCPYCKKMHIHGSNNDLTGNGKNEWGHRVSHCNSPKTKGYYLVGTEFTIKSEEILEL
jgi:hypothetical protein